LPPPKHGTGAEDLGAAAYGHRRLKWGGGAPPAWYTPAGVGHQQEERDVPSPRVRFEAGGLGHGRDYLSGNYKSVEKKESVISPRRGWNLRLLFGLAVRPR
jgi:hypothetical protein